MSLAGMKELLEYAEKHRFGIPAINVFNYESILFAVKAAEAENMPLIIQYFPGLAEHASLRDIRDMTADLAMRASVPICPHLDHSWSFSICAEGLAAGFPSVMADGSSLSYEENAALTESVVSAAHAMHAAVEAELGHVGSGSEPDDFENPDHFTDPETAARFAEETGCDSLAVAVGNAHGNYVKLPVLDFDRIRKLRSALHIPLVMHGGSDIPADQMQEAVRCGMSKFNIATEYQRTFYRASQKLFAENRKQDDYFFILRSLEEPCVNFVRGKIQMLNPDHYCLPGGIFR